MSSGSIPSNLKFHNNGGTYPPHGNITPTDHGPYVVVTTWIFLSLAVLALLARLGTRRNFNRDNVMVIVSVITFAVQSVTVHIAVNYGLGRHRINISEAHYIIYSKANYSSQLLGIAILCLTKLSLTTIFMNLTPSRPLGTALRIFMIAIVLWGVAAIFALAFQCQRPRPWDFTPGRCNNQGATYYSIGAFNIITDLVIIMFPLLILWNVQTSRKRKLAVFTIFASRILVCIAAAVQLSTLRNYLRSGDQTWLDVNPSIWMQVVIGLSIITACIPSIKPLLEQLQFSLIDSSVPWKFSAQSKSQREGNSSV